MNWITLSGLTYLYLENVEFSFGRLTNTYYFVQKNYKTIANCTSEKEAKKTICKLALTTLEEEKKAIEKEMEEINQLYKEIEQTCNG